MRLDDLLTDFLRSLRRRDLSPRTGVAYKWALDDLITKHMGGGQLADLTRLTLERWQDSLIDRGLKARSRSLAVTAGRQFIKYLIDREDLAVDPKIERGLARVKLPEGTPHPIPLADLEKLKAYFHASPDLRARALFFCLLTTGARIAEALSMRADNFHNPQVVQKGGTTKRLMMPPAVLQMLVEYSNVRLFDGPALWGDLTPAAARTLWKKATKELGIPYFTTHSIRHSCATELLRAGVPEIVIAEVLGHHGLGTIRNYAKVLDLQRQSAVDVMAALVQLA